MSASNGATPALTGSSGEGVGNVTAAAAASARTPRSGRRPGDKLKLRKRRSRSTPEAPAAAVGTGGDATPSNSTDAAEDGTRTPNNRARGPQHGRDSIAPNSDSSSSSSRYFTPGAEKEELMSSKLTGDDVMAIESAEKTEALVHAIEEGVQSTSASLEVEASSRLEERRFERSVGDEHDDVDDSGVAYITQHPLTQPASPDGSAIFDSDSDKDDKDSFASANGLSRRLSSTCDQDDARALKDFPSESRMNEPPPDKDALVVEELVRTEGNETDGATLTDGASMGLSQECYPLLTQPVASDVREIESDADDFMRVDDYGSPHWAMNGQEESDLDDDSSRSSSSSSSSDESNSIDKDLRDINITPRIVRNRRRNILRNEERLRILMQDVGRPKDVKDGQASTKAAATGGEDDVKLMKKKRKRSGRNILDLASAAENSKGQRRKGMLFATRYNGMEPVSSRRTVAGTCPQNNVESPGGSVNNNNNNNKDMSVTQEVSSRFPHRYPQIRLLCSTLSSTIQQSAKTVEALTKLDECDDLEHCNSYVPPPVFVTGPCGAGKTAVVRDVLQTLKRRHITSTFDSEQQMVPSIGEGYINCAAVEGSSAGAFLENAYKQILRSFYDSCPRPSTKAKKRNKSKLKEGGGGSSNQEVKSFIATQGLGQGVVSSHLDEAHSEEKETEAEEEILPEDEHGFSSAAILQSKLSKSSNAMRSEAQITKDAPTPQVNDESHTYAMEVDDNSDGEQSDGDMEDLIERQKKDHLRSKTSAAYHKKPSATLYSGLSALAAVDASGQEGLAMNTSKNLKETSRPLSDASQNTTFGMNRHHAINTPVDFGRALSPLCGGQSVHGATLRRHGCAFLVLDHGERLLSLTAKQNSPYTSVSSSERNNLLAQLLLLPRVMGLNLTVIVITTNSLLEFSRTNNIHSQPHLSLGTIQDAIQPLRIRFHAYRGKEIYKSILLRPKSRHLVIGCDGASFSDDFGGLTCQLAKTKKTAALERLYGTMINTVVQSLEGTTRDIREMLRFSRTLWPIYTSPLLTDDGEKLRKFIFNASADDASGQKLNCDGECAFCLAASSINADVGSAETILEQLDIKARPQIRAMLKNCLFTPIQERDVSVYPSFLAKQPGDDTTRASTPIDANHSSSTKQLSYMAKFLLLSAFLCQNNRQEQDLALFTTQNKGRRKKGRGSGTAGASENVAYASSAAAQQQLRTLRPALFPMERMLSVFSSILSKYGSQSVLLKEEIQEDGYIDVTNVGTARLFECMTELRDFGWLREMIGTSGETGLGPVNMAATKYSCALSYSDAEMIAKDVNFPLDKFLLQCG